MKPKPKWFIFKASWRSTMKLIKIRARDEEMATKLAARRKDIKGCIDLIFVKERVIVKG